MGRIRRKYRPELKAKIAIEAIKGEKALTELSTGSYRIPFLSFRTEQSGVRNL